MMCQLAPGFIRTDSILVPESCACHPQDRRVVTVVFVVLSDTIVPCVERPIAPHLSNPHLLISPMPTMACGIWDA